MIVNLVEQLRQSEGVRSVVAAGAIHQIFALHLDKENRLLMPLVVQSPEMSTSSCNPCTASANPHGHH